MVDRQSADHAPRDFAAFQRGDEQRNIAAAARRLPVIELLLSHGVILRERIGRASGKWVGLGILILIQTVIVILIFIPRD